MPRSSTRDGYSYRWQKARARYLLAHPLCVRCEPARITLATVVDHIVPHKGNEVLFWDETNWQALCKRHHDLKTLTEDRGRKRRQRPVIGLDGCPEGWK